MKRKIKAALRLLLCSNYILIVEDKDTKYKHFDFNMTNFEVKRNSAFLYNYLTESDNVVAEAYEIINNA